MSAFPTGGSKLLLARVEDAKIASTLPDSSGGGVSLDEVEAALATTVHREMVEDVLAERCEAIVATARRTVALAGLAPDAVDTLYFTGGSTGLPSLRQRLRAAFPRSEAVFGDPFGSVARGLGLRAGVVFA